MEPKNFAVYNLATSLIENIVLADPELIHAVPDFPPAGYGIAEIPEGLHGEWSACGIGWSYNGQFVEPQKP